MFLLRLMCMEEESAFDKIRRGVVGPFSMELLKPFAKEFLEYCISPESMIPVPTIPPHIPHEAVSCLRLPHVGLRKIIGPFVPYQATLAAFRDLLEKYRPEDYVDSIEMINIYAINALEYFVYDGAFTVGIFGDLSISENSSWTGRSITKIFSDADQNGISLLMGMILHEKLKALGRPCEHPSNGVGTPFLYGPWTPKKVT